MEYEELLELLEIKTPSEFVYFEQYAELVESPDEIGTEALVALFSEMEPGILSELTEGYFDDLLKFVPDDETELFTLVQTIATTLASLAGNVEDEEGAQIYAEEFFKFRSWYLYDGRVRCEDLIEGTENDYSVMEALTNYRLQSLGDGDYAYDFSEALDYPMDEYVVNLASLSRGGYEDDEAGDSGEDEDDEEEY